MKKILFSFVALVGLTFTTFGQNSATPIFQMKSLLTGYNVFVYTNGFTAGLPNGFTYYDNSDSSVGFGVTNVEFTTVGGQIVYSWTSNLFNTTFTNGQGAVNMVGDAFKIAALSPDVNGDINATAAFYVRINYTNDIPIAVTNSVGQYFVSNWVYQVQSYPNWMYPANTNVYPNTAAAATTNVITFKLFAVVGSLQGASLANNTPTFQNILAESTNSYVITIPILGGFGSGTAGTTIISNLPTSFTQRAHYVYANVFVQTNATYNGGQGIVINQMGILQPQP